jgi:AAA family ATP:ADP antiporter
LVREGGARGLDGLTGTAPRRGLLERLLRPISEVHEGEGAAALLLFSNLFLLMVGYYVLKTVREPLILAEGGAELTSYAAAVQAVLLMGFVPLYGWFSGKVDRRRLMVGVTLFFVVCLELFWLGGFAGLPHLGFVFFVWLGIFNMSMPAQFWSYANDVYTRAQGERLFPVIYLGASVGSPLGAKVAGEMFGQGVGPYALMQVSAVLLLAHMALYVVIDRRVTRAPREAAAPAAPREALGGPGGFTLILRSGYLRLLVAMLILFSIVNTTGEYIIRRSVKAVADGLASDEARQSFIGSFYGDYFFWVNVSAVLLQAFVASRLVKHAGIAGAVLALPLVSLGAYGLIAAGATFATVRWAKTAENATDYSIMNTARQLLWLPTSREEKYKAKQAADTFFVRIGDMVSAGVVFAGTTWLGLDVMGFAWTNVAVVALWILVALALIRRNRALAQQQQGARAA